MPKQLILCIDDEKTILESLSLQLQTEFGDRYLYEFAESASEGLEVIEEYRADQIEILIVVSDWLMPGMKGDEFLINLHKKYPKIIKVLLTGQADMSAIEKAKKEANLHKCLFKPWNEKDLIETISTGLKKL